MILPRLKINQEGKCKLELYYPDETCDETVFSISGADKPICEMFLNILYMSLDNYDEGYNDGYIDAMDDMSALE